MKKYFPYILQVAIPAIFACLTGGCEKKDEIRPVSLGLPIVFEEYQPGDSVLAGQDLMIKGKGMMRLTQLKANDFDVTPVKQAPEGVTIRIDPFWFQEGQYRFTMKRFDGELLLSTPVLHVFKPQLSAQVGAVGTEVMVTAGGGLRSAEKVLFTSADGVVEAPLLLHTATELRFKVPEGSVAGQLFLQLVNRANPSQPLQLSLGQFHVQLPVPVVNTIAPAAAYYGTELTITGENFGVLSSNGQFLYNRRVLFTGKDGMAIEGVLSVQSGSQTNKQIKVKVPYFAASGDVVVEIDNIAAAPKNVAVSEPTGATRLFYGTGNGIQVAIDNGQQFQAVPFGNGAAAMGISIERNLNRIYYFSTDRIGYVDAATGTAADVLYESYVAEMITGNHKIYWTDLTNIYIADLDGTNKTIVYTAAPEYQLYALCLKESGDMLYLGEYDMNTGTFAIQQLQISSGVKTTITDQLANGQFSTPLCYANGTLYFPGANGIYSVNAVAGASIQTLYYDAAMGLGKLGVDATANALYWFQQDNGGFYLTKSDLAGKNRSRVSTEDGGFPMGNRIEKW